LILDPEVPDLNGKGKAEKRRKNGISRSKKGKPLVRSHFKD